MSIGRNSNVKKAKPASRLIEVQYGSTEALDYSTEATDILSCHTEEILKTVKSRSGFY